jgi:hypothetical protein
LFVYRSSITYCVVSCDVYRTEYLCTLFYILISWSASQADLATIPPKGLISGLGSVDDVTSGQEGRPHQILQTKGKPGQLEVTANLRNSGSYLIGGFGSISDTISVNLVNDASISPEQVKLNASKNWFIAAHFITN